MRNKKSIAAHPEMYEIQLDNQQSEQKFLTKMENNRQEQNEKQNEN